MSAEIVRADMEKVLVRVLEDWGMMVVEKPEVSLDEAFNGDEPVLMSRLNFDGVVKGSYVAVCKGGFAKMLASNLLGSEVNPSHEEVLDVMKELINVASGNLLTASWGEDCAFALSSPVSEDIKSNDVKKCLGERRFLLIGDDEPVAFGFKIDQ